MSHGDRVVDMPVAVRGHVPMVQTAQNTVEVSQVHQIDRIADVSAMMQKLVFRKSRRPWSSHKSITLARPWTQQL